MTETIMGIITGIFGVVSVFCFGYEVGKCRGLLKAEKMFNEAINRQVKWDG